MDKSNRAPKDLDLRELINLLGSKNGIERRNAREELVARGKNVITPLAELLDDPKHICRWEAVKTMEEIGDAVSIPSFIQALQDDESDIRWIAAEGLIKLGARSIAPLLKALIKESDSIFILAGGHHVFYDLKKAEKIPVGFSVDKLLSALKNPELTGSVELIANDLLNNLDS